VEVKDEKSGEIEGSGSSTPSSLGLGRPAGQGGRDRDVSEQSGYSVDLHAPDQEERRRLEGTV